MKSKGQTENPSPPVARPAALLPKYHDEQLVMYKQLSEEIAFLEDDGVAGAAEEAKKHVEELLAQRPTAQESLAVAHKNEKRAQQTLETVETGCCLVMLFGGEKREQERRAENERQLALAKAKVREAEQRIEKVNLEIETARVKAEAASVKAQELETARANLSSLLQAIFSEAGWADDTMLSNLTNDAQRLVTQLAEITAQAETYGKGKGLLSAANKKVEKGMQGLETSRLISDLKADKPAEGPADLPAEFTPNEAQVAAIREANDLAKAAVEDFEPACEILPELPYKNEVVPSIARAGIFEAVLEAEAVEKEKMPRKIFDGLETVRDLQAGLQKSHYWTKQKIKGFEAQAEQLNASIGKKNELIMAYQRAQLKAAILIHGL